MKTFDLLFKTASVLCTTVTSSLMLCANSLRTIIMAFFISRNIYQRSTENFIKITLTRFG